MTTLKVGIIVGSISSTSINRRLAAALKGLAPDGTVFTDIAIDDLPLYSPDYDADYPEAGRRLKSAIEEADAILIVTPEYNRSIPAPLKNALDWASRPWGKNSFDGKPVAIIGTSPGAIGTAVAQAALRPVLGFLNVVQMGQPEAYIQFRPDLLDDNDSVTDKGTEGFLRTYMETFHGFAVRHKG